MEPASQAEAKKALRQQNRISAKEFIKMKRGQTKEEKSNAESYEKARNFISEGNVQKFQQFLSERPEFILNFLFSQDDVKQTPLMGILKNQHACNFFRVVNKWSIRNSDLLIRQIYMEDNQLKSNHFKAKFQALNKTIMEILDKWITKGKNPSELVSILKQKDSLFYHLCINFLTLDIIVATITSFKTKNNLLSQYYVKLLEQSQIGEVRSLSLQVKGYQQLLMKEKIWSKVDIGIMKQVNLQNIDLLTLSELKYNVWHELAYKNAVEFLKFQQQVCTLGEENEELQQKYWQILMEIDSSGQSVTDKCLRLWRYDQILQLLALNRKIQNLMLSTNCLNKLFYNRSLTQDQRQHLITECLQGEISTKGYVKVIISNRQKKWSKHQDKKFNLKPKPIKFTYNICYEKGQIKKQKDNSGGYPLITYLKIYKDTAKLKTVQQLYLQFLSRKEIKKKLSVILKTSQSRRIRLNEHSGKREQIQSLFDYYQPLWKAMTFLSHGDVLEFLISKIYINCYEIQWIKQVQSCEAQLGGTHFIVYYIKNSPFLGQDSINKQIVESIVKCKPSEKNIGQYNLIIELIKELNNYEPFHKSQQYLVSHIRTYLKNQLLIDYSNIVCSQGHITYLFHLICGPLIKQKPSILTKQQIIKICEPQVLREYLMTVSIKGQLQIFYRSILAERNIQIQETQQAYECFENNKIKIFFQLNHKYLKYTSEKQQHVYVYGQNTKKMSNFFNDLEYWLTEKAKDLFYALKKIQYKFLCFMLLPTQKYLTYKFKRLLGIGIDPYFPKYYKFKGEFHEQDPEWNKILTKMFNEKKTFLCALITSPNINFESFKDIFEIQKKKGQGDSHTQKQITKIKVLVQKVQNSGMNSLTTMQRQRQQLQINFCSGGYGFLQLYFANHNCKGYNLETINKIIQHTMKIVNNTEYNVTLRFYFEKNIKQMTLQIKNQQILLQKKGKEQRLMQQQQIIFLKNKLKSFIDQWLPFIISQSKKRPQQRQIIFQKYLKRLLQYACYSNYIFLCDYLIKYIEFDLTGGDTLFIEKLKYSSDACQILFTNLVKQQNRNFNRWMREYMVKQRKMLKKIIERCQFASQLKLINQLFEKIIIYQQQQHYQCKYFKQLIKICINSVSDQKIHQILKIIKDSRIKCKGLLISQKLRAKNTREMKILRLILGQVKHIQLQQLTKLKRYDETNFYSRCSDEIFRIYINHLQNFQYLFQNIAIHLKVVIECLVQAEKWAKLQKMLESKPLLFHIVPLALKSLYNISDKQQRVKNPQLKKIIEPLFIYLKDNKPQFNENLFVAAFSLDFKRAFQVSSIKQLSIYGWRKCIKNHPESSYLFLANKVTLNKDYSPTGISPKQAKRYKYWFPMMSHFADAIEQNQWTRNEPQWIVDEFKIELYLAAGLQAKKYLSNSLKALCTSEKFLAHKKQIYGEVLTDQQILLSLLRRNQLKSLQKYEKYIPQLNKLLKQCLFEKHPSKKLKCMNLTSLNSMLLKQLIVKNILYSQEPISMCSCFLRIVDTTNMYIIDLFIKTNNISINYEYLKTVHQLFGFHFWDRLLAIQNQDFIITFITKYKLFEIYETQEYSQKLLKTICAFKYNRLFQFTIKYFEEKSGSKAIFAAQTQQNRPSLSKKGYFYLPIEISIQNNFYQVYFLIQSCHNQCPKFNVSARFLSHQQSSQLNYIPQLKRRVQINNIFMEALRQAQQMEFRFKVLLPGIFQLQQPSKNIEINEQRGQQQSPQKKRGYNSYLSKFIQDITKKSLILNPQSSIFEKLCFMIFIKDKTKIPESQLQKRYPSQMKIINKIRSHILGSAKDVSLSHLFQCIPEFKAQLLIYNPSQFLKNSEYMQEIMGIGHKKLDFSEYLKGIQINFIQFETKHMLILQTYINEYFFNSSVSLGSPNASHQQTREALILILLDISQHQRNWDHSSIFNLCKKTKPFEPVNYQEMQTQAVIERDPQEILFDLSMCLNIRGNKQMAFDLMVWNKIIEQIHQIEKFWKQFGRGAINQYNLSQKNINQIAINYSEIGNKKFNNSRIVNLKDILCEVNKQQIKTCSKKGVFIQLSIIMNTLLLINDLKMLEKKIKSFNEGKNTYKINFKLVQNTKEKVPDLQDYAYISKGIKLQSPQTILVEVPYNIEQHQSKQCLLIMIETQHLQQKLEHFIIFHNLQKTLSIVELNNFCQKADRHPFFKNYKFVYNPQSYKWYQYEGIIHIYGKGETNNRAVKNIKEMIQKMQDKLLGTRNIKVYAASDLYGPINFAQEKDEERIIDCLGFYQLIELPKSTDLKVTSLSHKVESKEINISKLTHLREYIKYYIATSKDEKIDNFDMGNEVFVNEQWFRFGAWTVCEVYCLVLAYCSHLSSKIDKVLDVRFSFLSLIQYYEKYLQCEGQLDMRIALQQLLYQKYFSKLVQQIVLMIIEDVGNIMKIVKGIIVKWTINKKSAKKKANIMISQCVNANSVEYEVKDQLLNIKINLEMAKGLNKTQQLNITEQDCQFLVDRKQFLDSVFTSAQFLTDYFITRNALNNDCLRISTSITNKLNTTVNFHIQYANLYAYIDKMRNEKPIKVIESYLTRLKQYLSNSMEKTINIYLNSQQLANKHQVFILNKCESINKNIPFEEIQSQRQLIYDSLESDPPNGLKEITSLMNEIGNDENIKNVFFIQIYKSYYTTMVGEGMTFVVGYKSNKKKAQVIKITKAENINLINIVELDFIMVVSKNIPTNDDLNQSKIIRIFVTDSNKNLYMLNDKIKSYFLALHEQNEERNLAYFAPLIPSNIMLNFFVEQKKDFDTKDIKVFSIDLKEQNKFKLVPNFDKPLSPLNSCKKNLQFKEAISQLQKGFRSFYQSSMKFIIDLPQQYTEKYIGTDFSHIVHLVSTDLLQFLLKFQFQPMRNQQLDCKLSIEKQFILNKNSMIQLRKRSFMKHYDKLRIRIRDDSSTISFNCKEIIVCIDVSNMTTLPSSSQYLSTIIDNILKNEKKGLPKEVIFNETDKNESTQVLLKQLDILNCVPYQVEEIQEANKLIELIYHKKLTSFKIVVHKKKTQMKFDNGIQLYLNLQTAQRQFLSAEQIIRSYTIFANKNFEPNIKGQSYFNPITQTIITQECSQRPNKIIYKNLQNQWVVQTFNENSYASKCMIPSRYYLIQQENIYSNYFFKVDKTIAITQKNAQGIRCKSRKLYLQSSKPINLNFTNISISETNPLFKENTSNFNILRSPLQKNKIIIHIISKNMYLITINYEQSMILNINYSGNTNIFNTQLDSNRLVISSDGQLCLDNTKFIELQAYKKKPVLIKDKQNENKNSQFRQFNQKASQQQLQMKLGDFNNIENLLYVVNDQCKKFLTRAGELRVDYLQLCDNDSNPIDYKQKIDFVFVHINRLAIVRPEIIPRNMQFGLKWTPTVRGHYYLYINSVRINPPYEIGVCAAQADYKTTIITLPKIKKICYCEETELMLDLRDSFNNLYTQLQQDILGDSLLIQLKCSKLNQSLKIQKSQINKYGLKKVKFSFNNAEQQKATDIEVAVFLNLEEISRFTLIIQGLSLKQRKKMLDKDINLSSKNYYKDITINRNKFLQELFVVAQKSLHTNLSVKFFNEPGIDAGGVKRQFYDMVGNELKSQRNPFFKMINPNTMEYFLNPEILRNKKRLEYMQLWGKYLANSFLNSYLIGVLFSPVFVKLLYEQSIDYEDLLSVLPIQEKKQYEYLLTASPDDFEDLDLYFTVMIDKKKCIQVQLKQGGKDIQVTAQNVKQYLQRTAQVLIAQRYKEIMIAFRKGFETVLQLSLFKKWIRNNEFWCLTAGSKQLTPELVLNYIVFQGHNIQNISGWFRRFISEANHEVLVGFLKFSSGSSSIDFSMASKVTVTFENAGDNPKKLPISHTCWKEIVVPKYKNYDIMKKLLTAAFIYCSEGFGFG